MNKKAPTFLTLSAIVIGVLMILSNYYVPSVDAPQISMILHDADGVKIVSMGETAEYVIKVENNGNSRGSLSLSKVGAAEGWNSVLSHTELLLMPGSHRLVSLYVSPQSENAAPSIDVNVLATRGDNVTIVSTTTYLTGNITVRKQGETQWETFGNDSGLDEGDDLRTGVNSRVQVDFKEQVALSLYPSTEIHVTHSNELDGDSTYNILLRKGRIGISVELPSGDSTFIMRFGSGKNVLVNSTNEAVLIVNSAGKVRVLKGTVYLNAPIDRQGGNGMIVLTPGKDSDGDEFDHGLISFANDIVSGILKSYQGDTIGFDNSGNFVTKGNLDGFLFRDGDQDKFFVYGTDLDSISLELSRITAGTIDVIYSRYTPDLKGFVFENLDTPSTGTIFFRFQEEEVYLRSESELNYDLEIRYQDTERFYLTDMTLREGEGNSYEVINFVHIENDEVNSVLFGIDTDGDEKNDDEVMIHTNMNGDEVYEDLEGDEDASLWVVAVAALIIVLIIIGMYFVLRMGEQMEYDETPEGPEEPGEGMEGDDMKGTYQPFDLGEEPPDEVRPDVPDIGENMDAGIPEEDLPSGAPGSDELLDEDVPGEEEIPSGESDDRITFEEMEELRQPIGEHPPGSDDTQAETFGEDAIFTGEVPGPGAGPEPAEDDLERTMVEDLVDMKSDKILDEEYETIPVESVPSEPGIQDEPTLPEVPEDIPQPEEMHNEFALPGMEGAGIRLSDIIRDEAHPSDMMDEGEVPTDILDEEPPTPGLSGGPVEEPLEREPVSLEVPPGAESFAPPEGPDELIRDEPMEPEVPFVPVVVPGAVPSRDPEIEDRTEGFEEPSEFPGEEPVQEPEEEPYVEGDEIFNEIQENLFVVPEETGRDGKGEPSGDEGSGDDQASDGADEEEEHGRFTKEQIQENIRQVQELKAEMQGIETSSQDGEWWQDWHKDIKKDVDDLIRMGKESAEAGEDGDSGAEDTADADTEEDENDWIEKDPLFSDD